MISSGNLNLQKSNNLDGKNISGSGSGNGSEKKINLITSMKSLNESINNKEGSRSKEKEKDKDNDNDRKFNRFPDSKQNSILSSYSKKDSNKLDDQENKLNSSINKSKDKDIKNNE